MLISFAYGCMEISLRHCVLCPAGTQIYTAFALKALMAEAKTKTLPGLFVPTLLLAKREHKSFI